MGEVVAGSAAERRARFERATSPHLDSVYRVALRMTGAAERAEDAVQETYLRAWKYFNTFDEGKDARVWLFAILRNAVFEAARKKKREGKTASLDELGPENVVSATAARADGPTERLKEQEVLDAVDRLPDQLRMVALLAIVEGLKYREIADSLGIPIGTVMSRLFRARKLLRFYLRGFVDGAAGEDEDDEGAEEAEAEVA